MFQDKFKVPSYYKRFHCKGKECRTCCCQGWNVTLSENEYFKLLDENCSPYLKEKIEAYVGIIPNPTADRYARINFDYNGQCPLRLENGYCGLQVECGEENIAYVCRYYPRAPHRYPYPCCSISDSCEAILEELMNDSYSFSFDEMKLAFAFDTTKKDILPKDYQDKHSKCFTIVKEGEEDIFTLIDRIFDYLGQPKINFDNSLLKDICYSYRKSFSIADYLYFTKEKEKPLFFIYEELKRDYPNLNHYLKNIILNHFLYIRFPYVSDKTNYKENAVGLYYLVALWLYILFYNLKRKDKEEFTDITANFFRSAEQSNLYDVIAFYYRKRSEG